MVTILDGMNRLENLTRLVGRGTIWRFLLSLGNLVIPFVTATNVFLLVVVHSFPCTFSLTFGTRPPIVQDNEDMTALYSECMDSLYSA